MLTKKLLTGISLALGLGLAAQAQATVFSSNLTSGALNTFQDQSKEAFFDTGAGNTGVQGVGDVFVGFVRIDNKIGPTSASLNNSVYAVFSQQITAVGAGGNLVFGPTQVVGLRLQDIIPAAPGLGANSMFALYSSNTGLPYTVDLINSPPGDVTGNGSVTLRDYIQFITNNGTLDMIGGQQTASTCDGGFDNCFAATNSAGGVLTTAQIAAAPASVNFATFVAGLNTTHNPSGFVISDNTLAGVFPAAISSGANGNCPPVPPGTPNTTCAFLAILNGAVSGANGASNSQFWTNGSEFGAGTFAQCGAGVTTCGFIDNATFALRPNAVPEPATLALLGVGLLGLAASRRRRRG